MNIIQVGWGVAGGSIMLATIDFRLTAGGLSWGSDYKIRQVRPMPIV
jgi:hypothetical protein